MTTIFIFLGICFFGCFLLIANRKGSVSFVADNDLLPLSKVSQRVHFRKNLLLGSEEAKRDASLMSSILRRQTPNGERRTPYF
jgi:hypothetical protein